MLKSCWRTTCIQRLRPVPIGNALAPNLRLASITTLRAPRPIPPLSVTTRLAPSRIVSPILIRRAGFSSSAPRRDVFFVAFPALKAGLLDVSRVTLILLPFIYRYRLWKRWPRFSLALLQIPIFAVCIVMALAADQAPNTSRWRLLMMSHHEEQEWSKHRLRVHLAEEGPLIMPEDDPRVKQVLRVMERLITSVCEDSGATHIVSSAAWPNTLSSGFFEDFFRNQEENLNFYQRRDLRHDIKKPEDYTPSAIASSQLLPYRLESSNPMKVFAEEDWKIYVIDLPKINAFALPTKEIFVYRGLIDLLDDDALLSGVLAHEVAHVTQRHAVENAGFLNLAAIAFDCLRGISFAFTMSFPLITDAAAAVLNTIHDHVAEKAYSRKLEMEADTVGLKFMARAGYHPNALLDLWDIMSVVETEAAASGQPISISDRVPFLKTHPTSLDRQKNISALLPAAMETYKATATKPSTRTVTPVPE